jgi:hypothetical protein
MEKDLIHIDGDSQIVLYQPSESINLEVKIDSQTVWLNRQQMSQLFSRDIKTIGKHINNALREELAPDAIVVDAVGAKNATTERTKNPVVAKFATTAIDGKVYQVEYYNLDVILSVGYRVKSNRGIQFRRWATTVLRQHLLQGYSVNRHLIALQENMDKRMTHIEDIQSKQQQQLDFFIRTSTPPAEMVLFEGDFYKAREAFETIVRSARERVVVIDGYVSALTLDILDVRAPGVRATIYTKGVGQGMQRLMDEHDRLFPDAHVNILKWRNESHDRWLIADDRLYHCGHSLNAAGGHKLSAITLMGTSPDVILSEME